MSFKIFHWKPGAGPPPRSQCTLALISGTVGDMSVLEEEELGQVIPVYCNGQSFEDTFKNASDIVRAMKTHSFFLDEDNKEAVSGEVVKNIDVWWEEKRRHRVQYASSWGAVLTSISLIALWIMLSPRGEPYDTRVRFVEGGLQINNIAYDMDDPEDREGIARELSTNGDILLIYNDNVSYLEFMELLAVINSAVPGAPSLENIDVIRE